MRRTWFLVGLTAGLVIALHPVFDMIKASMELLADADSRVREAERVQARKDRIAALNNTPVGWGENLDEDGYDPAHPRENRNKE